MQKLSVSACFGQCGAINHLYSHYRSVYSEVQFTLGPHLNFIVGPNGELLVIWLLLIRRSAASAHPTIDVDDASDLALF